MLAFTKFYDLQLNSPHWTERDWLGFKQWRCNNGAGAAVRRQTDVAVLLRGGASAATKSGGGSGEPDGGGSGSQPRLLPVVQPAHVDSFIDVPRPVTNLCFWGVDRGTNAVALGIAWPESMAFTNGCLDVFGSHVLLSNAWTRLAVVDVSAAHSNAVVELPFALFPTNAMEETAFFVAADQSDSDGDWISDAMERLVLGTNPLFTDTDGDGLSDGEELAFGIDPISGDTDGDGLTDVEERGRARVLETFEWIDTSGLKALHGDGSVSGPGAGVFVAELEVMHMSPTSGVSLCGVPCETATASTAHC